jgi:hypothetical protein
MGTGDILMLDKEVGQCAYKTRKYLVLDARCGNLVAIGK